MREDLSRPPKANTRNCPGRNITAKLSPLARLSDASSRHALSQHRSAPDRLQQWDTPPSPGCPFWPGVCELWLVPICRVSTGPLQTVSTIPVSPEMLLREVLLLDVPGGFCRRTRAPGRRGMPTRGCAHGHQAPTAPGRADTWEGAALVPQKCSQQTVCTQPLCCPILLLFLFNVVLVSLGSCPGDIDGTKHTANKIKFSGTVPAGLYEICQYLLRIEVKLK